MCAFYSIWIVLAHRQAMYLLVTEGVWRNGLIRNKNAMGEMRQAALTKSSLLANHLFSRQERFETISFQNEYQDGSVQCFAICSVNFHPQWKHEWVKSSANVGVTWCINLQRRSEAREGIWAAGFRKRFFALDLQDFVRLFGSCW